MPTDDPLMDYRAHELQCAGRYFPRQAPGGGRLLEIGAGTGHQALELVGLGFQVDALDLDDSPYANARVFPITGYDGRHLPFNGNTFDIVFSSNVLEHVDDIGTLLEEIWRVLKPGGVAVHVMPTPAWRFWSLLTHAPWVAKRAVSILSGRRGPVVRELGRPKARLGLMQSLASVIPRRHGEHGNLVSELWSYRRERWIAEIASSGLIPVGDRPAGLFYTGSQLFGGNLGLPWRRRLASVLGSAVHVYSFQKPSAAPGGESTKAGRDSSWGSETTLIDPSSGEPLVRIGDELVSSSGRRHPVVNGIARFVPPDNYASAFGDQWNRFPKTQLDSYSGIPLSEDRLARCMRGKLGHISGKRVLEAGSGAGRFTQILLKHGAIVDSFDYSNAVEANVANNGRSDRLTLVQADIRHPPFPAEEYDCVVCLGVIQHTPNPEESIRSLWSKVKPGGCLVIDHYRWKVRNYLPPPIGVGGNLYRHYFLRLPKDRQFAAVKKVFDFWFPFVWRLRKSKVLQFLLARFTPIVNYYPHFGLRDREMYYEWMLLDTHDAMTDVYKHRRTPGSIRRTLENLGACNVIVTTGGNGVEASCEKPQHVPG